VTGLAQQREAWQCKYMTDGYSPPSEFLCSFFGNDEVPLQGSPFAEANLALLIRLTRDPVHANRDWATFLLSQSAVDTPVVRTALIQAAHENDDIVRDEALSGLALRDPNLPGPSFFKHCEPSMRACRSSKQPNYAHISH